ncbi:MAG TPA: hypothetical protein GXZ82_12785 [Firmicutes bacterium]|jgi:hypothetical protein|nr:hypothetical protein [Bacillota bacterium]
MARKSEKKPWLPQVTPPVDLTQTIMAAIEAEPAPEWEAAQSPTTDAPARMRTLRAYILTGLLLAPAFYLLLFVIPTALWEQAQQATRLCVQVAHLVVTSFRLVTSCLAFVAAVIKPLFLIVVQIGKTCVSLVQIATTGPMLPLSLTLSALTLLGNGLFIRILTGQSLLPRRRTS